MKKQKLNYEEDYFSQAEAIWFQATEKEFEGDLREAFILFNKGIELAVQAIRVTKNEQQMVIISNRIKVIMKTIQDIEIEEQSDQYTEKEDQDLFDLFFQEEDVTSYGEIQIILQESFKKQFNQNIVYPLRYPSIYEKSKLPYLFYGLPGTGKTLAIKKICQQSGARYIQTKQEAFADLERTLSYLIQTNREPQQFDEVLGHKILKPIIMHIDLQTINQELVSFIQQLQQIKQIQVILEVDYRTLSDNYKFFQFFDHYRFDIPSISDLEYYFTQITSFSAQDIFFKGITPGIITDSYQQVKHMIQKELFFCKRWKQVNDKWEPSEEGEEKEFGDIPYYDINFPKPLYSQFIIIMDQNKIKTVDFQKWRKQLKDFNLGECGAYDQYED